MDLLSTVIGAGGMALIWMVKHLLESQQREREGFQRDRYEIYLSVLKPIIEGDRLALEGKEAEFRKLRVSLALMAPDSVVNATTNLFEGYTGDISSLPLSEQVSKMATLFGGLMLAIRKDLGHPTTTLTDVDMLKSFVNDVDRHVPRQ